jgi:hypothetical protein
MADAAWAADAVLWDALGLRRSRDPYTLRGILACGVCGHRMYPVTMAGGGLRSYGCPYRCRGLVDAAAAELLVSGAAGRQVPFDVPDAYRAAFYAQLLVGVILDRVGAPVFTWRTGSVPDAAYVSPVLDVAAR